MDQRREIILRVLVENAPQMMDDAGFGKRRCVLATKVAIETFSRFGIKAEPIIVGVRAANKSWFRVAENPNATEADFLATDAHLIEVRTDPIPGIREFPGHLVAGLREVSEILDLDMKQFRRPGINVAKAASLIVPPAFWDGSRLAEYELPDGGAIAYKRIVDGIERDFTDGADWKYKAAWFPLVRNLTLLIEAALK